MASRLEAPQSPKSEMRSDAMVDRAEIEVCAAWAQTRYLCYIDASDFGAGASDKRWKTNEIWLLGKMGKSGKMIASDWRAWHIGEEATDAVRTMG